MNAVVILLAYDYEKIVAQKLFWGQCWSGILHKAVNNFTGLDLHTEENVGMHVPDGIIISL